MDERTNKIKTTDEEIKIRLRTEKDHSSIKTTDEEITLEFMYEGEHGRG